MTREERALRQQERERRRLVENAAREAGRGPLDVPFLLLTLLLTGVGLIMLFSASFPMAYYEGENPAYYLIRQGIFALGGIVALTEIVQQGFGGGCSGYGGGSEAVYRHWQ